MVEVEETYLKLKLVLMEQMLMMISKLLLQDLTAAGSVPGSDYGSFAIKSFKK